MEVLARFQGRSVLGVELGAGLRVPVVSATRGVSTTRGVSGCREAESVFGLALGVGLGCGTFGLSAGRGVATGRELGVLTAGGTSR